jgi:hypothetical protein
MALIVGGVIVSTAVGALQAYAADRAAITEPSTTDDMLDTLDRYIANGYTVTVDDKIDTRGEHTVQIIAPDGTPHFRFGVTADEVDAYRALVDTQP